MQVQLESTTKTVELVIDGRIAPARIWEGVTAGGVRCHAYIIRIAVANEDDSSEFDRDLQQQACPSAAVRDIPLRMIL